MSASLAQSLLRAACRRAFETGVCSCVGRGAVPGKNLHRSLLVADDPASPWMQLPFVSRERTQSLVLQSLRRRRDAQERRARNDMTGALLSVVSQQGGGKTRFLVELPEAEMFKADFVVSAFTYNHTMPPFGHEERSGLAGLRDMLPLRVMLGCLACTTVPSTEGSPPSDCCGLLPFEIASEQWQKIEHYGKVGIFALVNAILSTYSDKSSVLVMVDDISKASADPDVVLELASTLSSGLSSSNDFFLLLTSLSPNGQELRSATLSNRPVQHFFLPPLARTEAVEAAGAALGLGVRTERCDRMARLVEFVGGHPRMLEKVVQLLHDRGQRGLCAPTGINLWQESNHLKVFTALSDAVTKAAVPSSTTSEALDLLLNGSSHMRFKVRQRKPCIPFRGADEMVTNGDLCLFGLDAPGDGNAYLDVLPPTLLSWLEDGVTEPTTDANATSRSHGLERGERGEVDPTRKASVASPSQWLRRLIPKRLQEQESNVDIRISERMGMFLLVMALQRGGDVARDLLGEDIAAGEVEVEFHKIAANYQSLSDELRSARRAERRLQATIDRLTSHAEHSSAASRHQIGAKNKLSEIEEQIRRLLGMGAARSAEDSLISTLNDLFLDAGARTVYVVEPAAHNSPAFDAYVVRPGYWVIPVSIKGHPMVTSQEHLARVLNKARQDLVGQQALEMLDLLRQTSVSVAPPRALLGLRVSEVQGRRGERESDEAGQLVGVETLSKHFPMGFISTALLTKWDD